MGTRTRYQAATVTSPTLNSEEAWNIRVNSIHPGQIEETVLFRSASSSLTESLRSSIPMQRAGKPSECADLALFLASDASSFITGAEIAIDGGYSSGSTMFMRQQLKRRYDGA
jgi:3alpha(or 20beta)-hydroxysteroid dehydrogenase